MGRLSQEEQDRRRRDIRITNDLHLLLIHLCRPEAVGCKTYNAMAPEVFARHATNLRRILQLDGRIHLERRLIDIWDKDRGKDRAHIMAFIMILLNILAEAEDQVVRLIEERDMDQPLLPFV
ncbi:MAG: hypothetical protein AAB965_03345 [Patescibacteria group bacterium]